MKKPPFVRSAYNYDTEEASLVDALDFTIETDSLDDKGNRIRVAEASLTKQSFAEDADINVIVGRFGLNPPMPEGLSLPSYQDFAEALDFQSAQNLILESQYTFSQFPADIRTRFDNDPNKFFEFANNVDNRDEAISLGLEFNTPQGMKAEGENPAASTEGASDVDNPT